MPTIMEMHCSSKKCCRRNKDGSIVPDSRFRYQENGHLIPEGTIQPHEYVSSALDKDFQRDDHWMASCRGIRPDYRTVRCKNCGAVHTYDFATD